MKNKSLVLVAFLIFATIAGYAGTRNTYMLPVDQMGQSDKRLPCSPKYIAAAAGAVAPLLALDEAGIVYWVSFQAVTAADYVVLRDSATANSSSTPIAQLASLAVNDTKLVVFDPPLAVVNGLSINVSSQTMTATVCVREADGDL